MRVLITPMPWPSHYYQMVGVVWALVAAGHEVRVAGQPALFDAVTGTGITAVAAGGGYDIMTGVAEMVQERQKVDQQPNMIGEGVFTPEDKARLLKIRMIPHIRLAQDAAEDLVAFARAWRPDVVITDPLVYAAPLAAAAVGAPVVRHLWGPDLARHIGLPGSGLSEEEDPRAVWPEEMVELYSRYGAKPQPDFAVLTLDNCPDSLQLAGVPNRVAMRYVSYNGSMVAPPWVLEPADRPRVCVTWGSSTGQLLGEDVFMVPQILEALSPFDVEAVVAVRPEDRSRVPDDYDWVRVVENVPLNLFLPTCHAIVHGSSGGAALTSAMYGLPQLVLPHVGGEGIIYDQLTAVGAGIGLKQDESSVEAIRQAADAVLHDDKPREAARRLQREMLSQPPPSEIISTLEELV
ncbi:UDP:flavonoid glycosyltransferase YjiC (YdhE family) [Nonomuraea polychroma]|uniref:UDP:flavonoid glycosyltransferase YjiC (YdhE family) n=1 Tax=Nonomuraea polychroma TaxID=46176 RepID=A0A438LYY7_9ACTN|nr:nucleotide disphospho-sugar-binding domain-containing protein [Nonomuraea polychroma]RVX38755.1 UDP:flavonoid glycosyltransferase YjiC (YdhE family) [Nonomuraea polychroma]